MIKHHIFQFYPYYILSAIGIWLLMYWGATVKAVESINTATLVGAGMLYLASHFFRMMRLAILTLEEREQIFPTIGIHTLTAFVSSLFPFKTGEIIRLSGFIAVSPTPAKAIALWLSERFFDVVTICLLIAALYTTNVNIPKTLEYIFAIFLFASILGILVFFSVAKLFIFLNRYLVLESTSRKGLKLLKISHKIRAIEQEIVNSIQGRLTSLLLISIGIWALELLTIVILLTSSTSALGNTLMSALAAILPGTELGFQTGYQFVQPITLICLTLLTLTATGIIRRTRL